MAAACAATVAIRLHAVRIYGRVIHEYDPWFNFRATEHLVEHGSGAFSRWYDERSWYPLGRPVGATVYPALMYTARLAHAACAALGFAVSLNDVCVFLPAYGAVLTVCFVALLAYEASHSADAAIAAAWIAALIPAHAMRSVAGAYDNEAVAMPAIVCALWLWARSLRTPRAWPIALGAGAACGYVAAAWGAYPLVFNLVALHVGILLLLGRYTRSLHVAYACLWCAGTLYAASVPIVGRASFRSAEQLAPILAHGALAIAPALEAAIRTRARTAASAARMRCAALVVGLVACACAATVLNSLGALTPLSVRVRALFVAHAKTGNPLVDSVAEHRTTSRVAFVTYVHAGCVLAPIGAVLSLARWTDASLLLVAYLATTWFLSSSMVRLLVLVAPPVAAASGIALAALGGWAWRQLAAAWRAGSLALGPASSNFAPDEPDLFSPDWAASELEGVRHLARAVANALVQGGLRAAYAVLADWHDAQTPEQHATSARAASPAGTVGRRAAFVRSATWSQLQPGGDLAPLRPIAATSLLVCGATLCGVFAIHSAHVATRLSEPIIVTRFRMHGAIAGSSRLVIADDYREAYGWLRERSAPDARVLAWWDYGYHLNGIANRTSLADGNTWNHEHIALVGRCLLLPPADAHKLVRHLADFVLVWTARHAGTHAKGGGDDLIKAPHIARIAASVYADMNASAFVMGRGGAEPSDSLRRSLVYALHAHGLRDDAPARTDAELAALGFEEAFTSRNRMARVFRVLRVSEESRAHVADSFARLRTCHAEAGELHPRCRAAHGYPLALAPTLALARPFG